jgi:gamma-glutamylcyclotransferase (GGCT)/AIG2-like uncharacterized protein YtfP
MSPFPAHARFMQGCRFLGFAETLEGFTMYSWIDGRYPMIVNHGKTIIKGELYEVSEELLEQLDQYEGSAEYERQAVMIKDLGMAQIYVMKDLNMLEQAVKEGLITEVEDGDWKIYLRNKHLI